MPTDTLDVGGTTVRAHTAEADGPDAPGVIVLHPWWGLNADVIAFADRLATAGFHVLAPDLYGGAVTADPDEAQRLARAADEEALNAIVLAAVDRLAGRPGVQARIGVVGFSFGAHWAVWLPSQRDEVTASVVYYGSTGDALADSSTPVLGHFAADDPYETDEDVDAFERGLRDGGRPVTIHRYPGTGHWFAEPSRDAYRAEATDLAFERTVEFLRHELAGG